MNSQSTLGPGRGATLIESDRHAVIVKMFEILLYSEGEEWVRMADRLARREGHLRIVPTRRDSL